MTADFRLDHTDDAIKSILGCNKTRAMSCEIKRRTFHARRSLKCCRIWHVARISSSGAIKEQKMTARSRFAAYVGLPDSTPAKTTLRPQSVQRHVVHTLIAFAVSAAAASTPATAERLTIHDLGTLPGGPNSYATAINNRGEVVGYSNYSITATAVIPFSPPHRQFHAFVLRKGVMTDLGALPGGTVSQASSINERGQIVGFSTLRGLAGPRHAFIYDKGVMTDLGTLAGGLGSQALGINNRSQVVGVADPATGSPHAFLLDNGVMRDLGTLPGGDTSEATAIDNRGRVVGYSSVVIGAPYTTHAFSYDNGVMTDLGTLPGGTFSQALATNNKGEIVGYADNAGGAEHAFLYRQGQMVDLGTLPGGTYSVAMGINERGDVVGVADNAGPANHAFLYSDGVMTDLGTLPGGVFSEALGINEKGDVVGDALTSSGNVHAVLWSK